MSQEKLPPCRLFIMMARESKSAVIFRRGPSKWTQLIKWDTKNDKFEYGHWFKGRIYEKNCDLSPNGELLLYFVSKFNHKTMKDSEYSFAWTAISKPPWLTALALWPRGAGHFGGGLFEDYRSIALNYSFDMPQPHPDHLPPRWLNISKNPMKSTLTDSIYLRRLTRDGWHKVQEGEFKFDKSLRGYVSNLPEIRTLKHPSRPLNLIMERSFVKLKDHESYKIENRSSGKVIGIDGAQCAQWDHKGRLVYASEGKLYVCEISGALTLKPKELADFNNQTPYEMDSPRWAKKW